MTDRFSEVLQRLTALRGTSWGVISEADVKIVAGRYSVLEEEMPQLLEYLKSKGLEVISEEEKARLLSEKVPYYTESKQAPREENKPRFSGYDRVLENALLNEPEGLIRQQWFARVESHSSDRLRQVFAMKQEGVAAERIAQCLECTLEDVYIAEFRLFAMLHAIRHLYPRRRRRRRTYIRDFYK